MNEPEPTVTFEDKVYKVSELSEEAREQLVSLQFCDAELARLNALVAGTATAKDAYRKALADLLTAAESQGRG